jgi:hypothetical protein
MRFEVHFIPDDIDAYSILHSIVSYRSIAQNADLVGSIIGIEPLNTTYSAWSH